MRELVNELTGESLALADYVGMNRGIEKRIFRLDNTIADLRAQLKALKGEREKEVGQLRSNAREIRLLERGGQRIPKRKSEAKS